MRIVHVANFYGPQSGGLRTTMHALGAGYRAAGHESVLVVPGRFEEWVDTEYGTRVSLPSREVPGTGGYRVMNPSNVTRTLVDLDPDRLEVSDRTTLRGLGRWAGSRGIPNLVWAHERVDGVLHTTLMSGGGGYEVARRVADAHNRGTAAGFDRVVCTTSYAAEEFDRVGAVNVVRVPLGVDLETFSPAHHDVATRQRLVGRAEVLIVLCSRLSPEKRPELAVLAVELLRRRGVYARLVVAGTGPREAAMRGLSRGLPVTMLGFVSDRRLLGALLATADVVIAPGPIETFGLAALEALASGTPVVASRTSALGDVVGDAGRVGDPTPEGLADAVADVLACDEADRRAAARRRAEHFPWSRTVESLLALHATPRRPATPLPRARASALIRASYARTLAGVGRHASGAGPRVVGLGDSVTLGVGDLVEPGGLPGWAAHVAVALDACSYRNLSRLGARARTVVDEQLALALAYRPDIALVSAGGNDVLRGDLDLDEVACSTRRYVLALRDQGVTVVLMRPAAAEHVTFLPARLRRALQQRLAVVNGALDTVAAETGTPAVTLRGPASPRDQTWHVDRIHPGPRGHRVLADAALAALAGVGFVAVCSVPPVTLAPPSSSAQAGWLLRNGVPWALKRSVDLLPTLRHGTR